MAINKNLLLPSSASSSAIVAKTFNASALASIKKVKPDFSNVVDKKTSLRDLLVSINEKVIKIDKVLKKTTLQQTRDSQRRLREERIERTLARERKLEERKGSSKLEKPEGKQLPGVGFLDGIKRFLFFTFLGWLTNTFWDKIPVILDITKKLTPVINVIETIGGAVFNGVVNFIDTGYKVYDGLRDFTKQIGGENFQKTFDDFSKNLNTFINLAIIAGMATMGGTDFGTGGRGRNNRGVSPKGWANKKGGGGYKQAYDNMLKNKNLTKGEQFVKRDYERFLKAGLSPDEAAARAFNRNDGFFKASKTRGNGFSIDVAKDYRSAKRGLAVKPKTILSTVRPFLKRIPLPVVGALIDFGLSVALGEPLGRAAFKAIGAGLLGAIGTGFGGPLGAIIGGFAGDWAGGKVYDILFGGKKDVDDKSKTKKKAVGGVTRGGKEVPSNIGRTLKVQRTVKRILVPPKPTKITPGIDVGGQEKYMTMFPEPSAEQSSTHQNPFGFLHHSTRTMGDVNYIGPMFSLFGKLLLGQAPRNIDYKIVGLGLQAWINNAITQNLLPGNNVKRLLQDLPYWVERSMKDLVTNVANNIIDDLKRNLLLKTLFGSSGADGAPGELGEGLGVYVSSNSPDFWLLATAAMFENSDPQGAADVAQAIYNRVAMPGDPWNVDNSISKAILNPGQFQPVRQYGGTSAWSRIKTKEDALRFVKSHGKTQAQLETVAAAILDKSKQESARQFVGPRDSFRAESYEKEVDHLANDTEKTRHGHTFGFEPRGATIGKFRAGQLSAAQVSDTIQGNVKFGASDFIQGNSGASDGVHFHVGTTKRGDPSGPAAAAFNVIKHFLGKKSIFIGRSREFVPQNATDEQIRKIISRGQAAHRQTEIDIQVGGAYGQGNRVAFPLQIKNHRFEPGGYGMKADIVGVNAFVGHGRYTRDGKLAQQEATVLSKGAPDHYYKGGGVIGSASSRNFSGLRSRTSYDEGYTILIQPIIIREPVPVGKETISFSGGGSVNTNSNKSSLFIR